MNRFAFHFESVCFAILPKLGTFEKDHTCLSTYHATGQHVALAMGKGYLCPLDIIQMHLVAQVVGE